MWIRERGGKCKSSLAEVGGKWWLKNRATQNQSFSRRLSTTREHFSKTLFRRQLHFDGVDELRRLQSLNFCYLNAVDTISGALITIRSNLPREHAERRNPSEIKIQSSSKNHSILLYHFQPPWRPSEIFCFIQGEKALWAQQFHSVRIN